MKYLDEYRDGEIAKKILREIKKITTRKWTIMEICGGQTHSLVKHGILELLPDEITMVHGPGCPVCVTPVGKIDEAVNLAKRENVILCSFGDMLRVPGKISSLLEAKAQGGDVRMVYSPLEAVEIARKNPDKEVVFFAVGFETTAPANALSVMQAKKMGLSNYSLLISHVLVPPAMEAILGSEDNLVQGFLAAGHVCTIMGIEEYHPIAKKYEAPIVITGFEPIDLLTGILELVKMLESGEVAAVNAYARVAKLDGNPEARKIIEEVFKINNSEWRGLGEIPDSGYGFNQNYQNFNAEYKFKLEKPDLDTVTDCISGEIMKGLKKPLDCPLFGNECQPMHPVGAPMVSSEGACAAYYMYHQSVES